MNFPNVHILSVLPEMILLAASIVVLLLALFLPDSAGRFLNWIGAAAVALALVTLPTLWSQTVVGFGGEIAIDHFAIMLDAAILLSALVGLLLGLREVTPGSDYVSLVLWASIGMMVLVSAQDLLTIFLGLEVLSLPLYILAGFRRERKTSQEAAMKYLIIGAFSSGIFLYGLAFLYGATGQTTLIGIAHQLIGSLGVHSLYLELGVGLVLVGLGFKLALVPFQQWVPDVYEGAPTPVTAFMSVGTKAAAFGVLARLLMLALPAAFVHWQPLVAFLAVLTLLYGNLAALRQRNMKRMLAYSGIAHAGYLTVAIVANSQLGMAAGMFYMIAYAFMNLGAFAVVAALSGNNEEGAELENYRGLFYRRPWLAGAMTLFLLALASIPPLVGFPAKFYILRAAVANSGVLLAIAVIVGTAISLYYYLRPIVVMLQAAQDVQETPKAPWPIHVAVGAMLLGTIALGVFPGALEAIIQGAFRAMYGL